MTDETSSAASAADPRTPLDEFFAQGENLSRTTQDETIARDLRLLWEEKVQALKAVNSLSPVDLGLPDEWADMPAGKRRHYIDTQVALDTALSYTEHGWQALQDAASRAKNSIDVLRAESKKMVADQIAEQARRRESVLRKIQDDEAALKDLEERRGRTPPIGLGDKPRPGTNQAQALEIEIEYLKTSISFSRIELDLIGDQEIAELMQHSSLLMADSLGAEGETVAQSRPAARRRRRGRSIRRWSSAIIVAVVIYICGTFTDGDSFPWPAAFASAMAYWLADKLAIEPFLDRWGARRMLKGLAADIEAVWKVKCRIRCLQALHNSERREKGVSEVILIPIADD